jgi:hypothetical protein
MIVGVMPKGNAGWGSGSIPHNPESSSEFEMKVKKLGLREHEYVASAELKGWAERNHNRCYVPEWLLKEWQLQDES